MRLQPPWSVVGFWIAATSDARPGPDDDYREVRWETGTRRDLDLAMAIARATGLEATEVHCRFTAGSRWIYLERDGAVVSNGWVSTGQTWIGELGCWFTPAGGSVYVWDCQTSPRYQGQGLYPALLQSAISAAHQTADKAVWIGVEWDNWRSIGGIIRAGFRPVGVVAGVSPRPSRAIKIVPSAGASDAAVLALRQSISVRRGVLSHREHRQRPQSPGDWSRLLAADRRTLEGPSTGSVDPDLRESA
jgi:GNAT superfamily N-acetyltransferase